MSENEPGLTPEFEVKSEPESMLDLAKNLGFSPSKEMIEIQKAILESAGELDGADGLISQWLQNGEEILDEINNPLERLKVEIGMILAQADLYRKVGNEDSFYSALEDANLLANGLGLSDVCDKIENISFK